MPFIWTTGRGIGTDEDKRDCGCVLVAVLNSPFLGRTMSVVVSRVAEKRKRCLEDVSTPINLSRNAETDLTG